MSSPSSRRPTATRLLALVGLVALSAITSVPAMAQPFVPVVAADTASDPLGLIAWNGDLYYIDSGFTDTLEVLPGGTPPARDVAPYFDGLFSIDNVYPAAGRNLVYHINDGELWRTDGTAGGSYRLVAEDAFGLNRGGSPVTLGDVAFFERDFILWRSDGTPGGTQSLGRELNTDTDAAVLGGRLYFILLDGRLFRTQGDGPGNGPYFDPPGNGQVRALTTVGDRLYFFAQTAGNRFQLHNTGGGASRLVSPQRFVEVRYGRAVGDQLFFFATGENTGPGLWVSDGNGVVRLTGVNLGNGDPVTRSAAVDGELWWLNGATLWRSDGSPAGTTATDLLPQARSADRLYGAGDWLVARLDGPGLDRSLWLTNGTPEGTLRVGVFDDLGREVVRLGNRIYFGADGPGPAHEAVYSVELADGPVGPRSPLDVRAEGLIDRVRVTFDPVPGADRYVVQFRAPFIDSQWTELAVIDAPAGDDEIVVEGGTGGPSVPFDIRVRAENQLGESPWSETATAAAVGGLYDCAGGSAPSLLCLQDGRFHVEVWWRSARNGTDGRGTAVPFDFSDDSGTFWFFNRENVELVVKVLDGRVINGNFWNFYGALSDVEYWVMVTDAQTRTNVVYRNAPGDICGDADINAFPRPDLLDTLQTPVETGGKRLPSSQTPELHEFAAQDLDLGTAGACVPDDTTLCLTPNRFRVTVTWRDQRSGDTGVGRAIPGTSDSGYFWFFDRTNVELVVKVLDATTVNGFHWVFYGALTDVEYTLTITDTATGETKQYVNPPGNICGEADVRAF